MAKSFLGKGTLVKEAQEAYPALKGLDLSKTQDLETFLDTIETLSQSETALPVIGKLVNAIEENQTAFAEMLIANVVDKLESRTTMFPEFMENFRKDFTYNGTFRPEFLVADYSNGILVPRIEYSNK